MYALLSWKSYDATSMSSVGNCLYGRVRIGRTVAMVHSSLSPTNQEEIAEPCAVAMNICDTHHRRAFDNMRPAFGDGCEPTDGEDEKLWPTSIQEI